MHTTVILVPEKQIKSNNDNNIIIFRFNIVVTIIFTSHSVNNNSYNNCAPKHLITAFLACSVQ